MKNPSDFLFVNKWGIIPCLWVERCNGIKMPFLPKFTYKLNIIPIQEEKSIHILLGWPKSSFGIFCNILWKTLNELSGQPNKSFSLKITVTSTSTMFHSWCDPWVNWLLQSPLHANNMVLWSKVTYLLYPTCFLLASHTRKKANCFLLQTALFEHFIIAILFLF